MYISTYTHKCIYKLMYVCCCVSCSVMPDSATPWAAAHQAPMSTGFSRQESCSGLLLPPQGDPPDAGIKPESPALASGFFTPRATWEATSVHSFSCSFPFWFYHRILNATSLCSTIGLVVDPFSEQEFASASPRLPLCVSLTRRPLTTTNLFTMSVSLFPSDFVIFLTSFLRISDNVSFCFPRSLS